jgi:ribokinase
MNQHHSPNAQSNKKLDPSDIKIIAIGAASEDVYLSGPAIQVVCDPKTKQCVEQFAAGAKIEVSNIFYSTGGGATNAAVTFARSGLHALYAGKIGHDAAGEAVINDLLHEGVDTTLVKYSKEFGTQYSTILLAEGGERTVLIYRGAAHTHEIKDYDVEHMHADWMYISSLAGSMGVLKHLVDHAFKMGIKIALNAGTAELNKKDKLLPLLPKLTILAQNKEEMQQLFGGDTLEEITKNASATVPYVVVTDGPNGLCASDGEKLYSAGMYADVPVVDRLGAGDAFASGFVSYIAQGKSVEEAIVYGSANSTSVVSQIGAKAGILTSRALLHDMDIKTSLI